MTKKDFTSISELNEMIAGRTCGCTDQSSSGEYLPPRQHYTSLKEVQGYAAFLGDPAQGHHTFPNVLSKGAKESLAEMATSPTAGILSAGGTMKAGQLPFCRVNPRTPLYTPGPALTAPQVWAFMQHVREGLVQDESIGYTLSLFNNGQVYSSAYGYARTKVNGVALPQSPNLRQFIGSMEKAAAFVAAVIMLCKYKISNDQKIGAYLPSDFGGGSDLVSVAPGKGIRDITFKELLAMRSGMKEENRPPPVMIEGAAEWDLYRVLKQDIDPNDKIFEYDNANYTTLGFLLYHMAGNPFPVGPMTLVGYEKYNVDVGNFFAALLDELVLKPAGIVNPQWGFPPGHKGEIPYYYAPGRPEVPGYHTPLKDRRIGSGVGSITLSSDEWLRFINRLAQGYYIPPTRFEQLMQDPGDDDNWRSGMRLINRSLGRYLFGRGSHSDSITINKENVTRGMKTTWMIFPKGNIQVVVLINDRCRISTEYLLINAYELALKA